MPICIYVSLSAPIRLGDMVQLPVSGRQRSYIVVQINETVLSGERVKQLNLALPEQVTEPRSVSATFQTEITEEGRAMYLSLFGPEAMDWPEVIGE